MWWYDAKLKGVPSTQVKFVEAVGFTKPIHAPWSIMFEKLWELSNDRSECAMYALSVFVVIFASVLNRCAQQSAARSQGIYRNTSVRLSKLLC